VFTSRQKWDQPTNLLSQLRAEKRRAGVRVLDLTESNPTQAGFDYPAEIFSALANQASRRYDPDPRGLASAREAVSGYYAERDVEIPASRILLTASTSEAYSYLFKLLANPGDEILVPRPSYPLFDFLAGLECVRVVQYPLRYDGAWHVDFDALERAVTERTRAVVVVNPNNPTGSFLKPAEALRLEHFAASRDLAILSDEVFADYGNGEVSGIVATLADQDSRTALTFSMSGLSKIAGLPQMKLGWIVASGPQHERALDRLEWIADTFLSVATPVQAALPLLLELSIEIRAQIWERTDANLALLRARTRSSTANVLTVEGGWYAILQVPRTRPEEQYVIELLRDHDVLVQPGFFYDFESEAFLVVSLLTEPAAFEEGVRRIMSYILAPPLQINTSPLT
jgi:alanine-synthesizing transaminase